MNHLNRIIFKESIIYQDEQLEISVGRNIDNSIVPLLKRSIYGTKGPKYQHTGQQVKLQSLKNPIFFTLKKQGETIGFYGLCEREIWVENNEFLGYYGRYLAIDAKHQGNNYGNLLKKVAIEFVETHSTSPSIFYAYIEENNTRSLRISQKLGFTSITTLEAIIFSRLYPKANHRVVRITDQELPEILENWNHRMLIQSSERLKILITNIIILSSKSMEEL